MDGNEDVYESEENCFSDLALQCSERLSQMTKTYNDIAAVTKLLEEKEKDLELAAKIGKSLLERNKELQQTNEFLEEQLNIANEQVTQLKHELQQKIDLLHVFTDSEVDSGGSTPSGDRCSNWGTLQKKLRLVEEENQSLKLEANHLKSLTQGLEEKEQQLVTDCFRQLTEANANVEELALELAEKSEEYAAQQREISHLLKELVEKQNSEKTLSYENDELSAQIHAAQETQLELTQELMDLQERYAEVVALLAETREELKTTKEKLTVKGKMGSPGPDSMYDSLASEIEASDSSFSGFSPFVSTGKEEYIKPLAVHHKEDNSYSHYTKSTVTTPTVNTVLPLQQLEQTRRRKIVDIDDNLDTCRSTCSFTSDINARSLSIDAPQEGCDPKSIVKEVESSLLVPLLPQVPSTENLVGYPAPGLGVPGIPGSKDLEFAIKRLSLRRRVELECQKYRRSKGGAANAGTFYYSPLSLVPNVTIPTYQPGAVSTATSGLDQLLTVITTTSASAAIPATVSSASQPVLCKSKKTVLVKPLEGSSTLNQWKELATPSLTGSLAKRPGIKVKGGSPPITNLQSSNDSSTMFSTPSQFWASRPPYAATRSDKDSGVNSDVDTLSFTNSATTSMNLSMTEFTTCERRAITTPGTYTFVSSKVMHPSDRSSYAVPLSRRTSCNDTPQTDSRASLSSSPGEGTSTFSMAYNLASALKERCVDLVPPSWWVHPVRSSPMATTTTNSVTTSPSASVVVSSSESKPSTKNKMSTFKPANNQPMGLCSLLPEDNGLQMAASSTSKDEMPTSSGIVMRSSAKLTRKDSEAID